MVRFRIEDIVHPDSRGEAEKNLSCPVCLGLLDDPVETSCHHLFCRDCISPLLACPVCLAGFKVLSKFVSTWWSKSSIK